jgi:hypothetical protein
MEGCLAVGYVTLVGHYPIGTLRIGPTATPPAATTLRRAWLSQ